MLIRFRKSDGTEYPQWEEYIVESQIEELSLKTTINNEYPILSSTHSGIKLQNEYFNKQTASEDNVGYKIVPYGYFTYRAMSDTGKFVFNQQTLLDKGIVSPAYPVFKVIESNADYFRYFMNESKDIKSQILILKEGSTRFALPASKLKKLKIKLPCIEEQQKIADFLSTVDQKIEEQKAIVADYEELKKGTMQKIFNQEIRFKDDDGNEFPEWEEIFIEKVIEEYNIKTTVNNEYPILSSTHSGIVLQNDYFNKQTASEDNTGYKIVPAGYFTYRAMSDTGKFVFNQQTLLDKGIVSPAYPVFKVIYGNETFFRIFMNDSRYVKSQILMNKEGSTRFALSMSKLKNLKIKMPCLEEQKKIADCLSALDRKIEAEKKILADLEELKKGLLQGIFNN